MLIPEPTGQCERTMGCLDAETHEDACEFGGSTDCLSSGLSEVRRDVVARIWTLFDVVLLPWSQLKR